MIQRETHPFKWFVPTGSKVMIIGTFPPVRKKWSYEFFYPNKHNFFWKIIARLAQHELQHFAGTAAVAERKQLLRTLSLAISDMGHEIERANESSLDENLSIINFMDILAILDEYPSIEKLIFTSSSGRSSAAGWFVRYLNRKGINHKFPKTPKPVRSIFHWNNRTLELVILNSPSPRAANRISFAELVEQYRKEIVTV